MGISWRKRNPALDLPSRDWAALPCDILWVILSLVPQADILRGAGLVCASWRRLALDEPILWRRIDLPAEEDEDVDPPAGWQAMTRAAVRRSAGRCEYFRGRVDDDVLLFLAHSAPLLRSLHLTSRFDMPGEELMTAVAKKLPLLEQLVISRGRSENESLVALVDHCPRLQLLDVGGCHTFFLMSHTLRTRLQSKIKDLRLPRMIYLGGRLQGLQRKPPPTDGSQKIGRSFLSSCDLHVNGSILPYPIARYGNQHSAAPALPPRARRPSSSPGERTAQLLPDELAAPAPFPGERTAQLLPDELAALLLSPASAPPNLLPVERAAPSPPGRARRPSSAQLLTRRARRRCPSPDERAAAASPGVCAVYSPFSCAPHHQCCCRRGRDWAALPCDILWVILSLVPQADILRGAGLVCASWRRLALDEPLLWRRIDLHPEEDEDVDPPAGWQAMTRAAVRRSAGRWRCEYFRGRVDDDVLLFLAHSAPLLRSLHLTSRFDMPGEELMTAVAKKLPLLEQLVISRGRSENESLVALVDHCPRLQLLDVGGCHTFFLMSHTLRTRLQSKIKDLRLPRMIYLGGRLQGLQRKPPVSRCDLDRVIIYLILDIVCWNVRGLNDQARKDTVHATLSNTTYHIACIQETKLDFIDYQTAGYIGGFRLRSFAHRPVIGTRGGILLLWDEDHASISNIHIGTHLLSADVTICGTAFKITTVYDPSPDAEKASFLDEAIAEKPADNDAKWLILGDSRRGRRLRLIHDHFSAVLGAPPPRSLDFNWEAIQPSVEALDDLGIPFSEEEILATIQARPADKAPGPDGFTIEFFCACWPILKLDFMKVIDAFSELSVDNLGIINPANVVLLPKKEGADTVADFRPISLIHIVPKIIAKAMAIRLQAKMNDIISPCQSAFISSRSIHDNFMYVRGAARRLHQRRSPALIIKLDIAKAFDSVRWDYILDLLQRRGFRNRWSAWIALLFSTSISRILLNGFAGYEIVHGRGLRQGDLLSPLLFDIAMDPLL
ncbi:hypothetical protein QYE76_071660 [Lolium multiflorum]|uniref:F-box domain-containing protein n=1 Tax=Lolium multiflorum TaxID=4521 RepID=A0AAD8WFL7_LOLMU|nr:hypothetical protein QYE76_071660 [Lolium multiflorum]